MAKRGAHITKKLKIDPELKDFFGKASMSRGDALKKVWEYIRGNELGGIRVNDKAGVNLDEELQFVFDTKKKKIKNTEIMSLLKNVFVED